ncbi:secreted immunoglobulin domain 1 [Toxotes jaculatrix]|uniref:secreted immunoglobulin domain 1 n=1 Tax=Toxotes jaculatrix TaxID=941984 RepID=UPI001B3A9681|nr:secreted immunoglobulin domain 1 [Toxotes jaculatrix]
MKRSAGFQNSSSSFLSQLMMESLLVCLILVSLSGFRWEHQAAALTDSTIQVRVGEDATLRCPLLDKSNASTIAVNSTITVLPVFFNLSWYKKAAGQGPQLLLSVRSTDSSDVKYGSGVGPDKVSAAADGSLLLRRSELSDSAVYYCGISQGEEPQNKPPPQTQTSGL